MLKLGIIETINEPTDWVNSLVIVQKKDGNIRLCLDPKPLNECIKRSHYQFPTFEEIIHKIKGAKLFTVLDAKSGFWMLPLDEECAKITTFQTPFGRFYFKRLPFGLSCAPEIFHRVVSQIFEKIDGVQSFQDDILIWGETEKQLTERVNAVLDKAQTNGFKFNINKCKFNVKEINFLGHKISSDGISVDENKIKAIIDLPIPKDKKELARILGMFNYVSKFIENFSEISQPLRALLKKDVEFTWNKYLNEVFNKLKKIITQAPVLSYFDQSKPILLSVDASSTGLGACLLQDNKPVCYASKALTETQINYAQIEKELLGIVFGCTRFHQYIFSKNVTVETDHKPLIAIFKKPLSKISSRLQRMLLRLQQYKLNVVYKPGKELVIADTLSRHFNVNDKVEDEVFDEIELQVNLLIDNLPISHAKWLLFEKESKNDEELNKLKDYINHGWPKYKSNVNDKLKCYFDFKDELSIIKNLIFKGDTIIVPKNLRTQMMEIVHQGHMGINRCKSRARLALYWPNMSNDIKNYVESCRTCSKFKRNQSKMPLLPHRVPKLPWSEVGIDVFEWEQMLYIVAVDYYSNYIEIASISNTKSVTIISKLKSFFSRHGIPLKVYSDGATYFKCEEFRMFCKNWDIEHVISSPHFPQSNGMAESAVKTMKSLLKKTADAGEDIYLALLSFRNTNKNNVESPAQLLMSRKLRTLVPMHYKCLKPKLNYNRTRNQLYVNKQRMKGHFDRHSKPLQSLCNGQDVLFQKKPNSNWSSGNIIRETEEPRSYIVIDQNGKSYRRNRIHISPAVERMSPPKCPSMSRQKNEISPLNQSNRRISESVNSGQKVSPESDFLKDLDNYKTRYGRVVKSSCRLEDKF